MPQGTPRIVAIAPFRQDAPVLRSFFEGEGIAVVASDGQAGFAAISADPPDLVVLTQEALTPDLVEDLSAFLRGQPPWSDVPVIVIVDEQPATLAFLRDLHAQLADRSLTILHRPLRKSELISAVRFALAARRRQIELRDHLDFQAQLKRELSHRVKNILANVSALFYMTLKQSTTLEGFVPAFQGRLNALSRVHGQLVASEWTRGDLGMIARSVLDPYSDQQGDRIRIAGPAQPVGPGSAVTLGLLLHELATNAAKYGALLPGDGRLDLSWARQDEPRPQIVIAWTESGGPPVRVPERQGFGTTFIRSVVEASLGGSVDFDWREQGLACVMRLPLTALERK